MPIAPIFPSGGEPPAPAGPTLRSIGNLNGGSYTFTDTALVALSSYAYDSATDTSTFNLLSIATAAETNSLISGPNFTGPKWRQSLTYADGSPVLVGDAFALNVRYDNVSVGAARQYLVALAVVETATSTIIGTMRPSGIYALTNATGVPGVGVVADNIGQTTTLTGLVSGVGTTIFTGGSAIGSCGKGGGSCAARSATTISTTNRLDGNTWASSATTQLSLAVMVSTNGTVTTTGGALALRCKYAVTKLS